MAEITLSKIMSLREGATNAIARIVTQLEEQTFCSVEKVLLEKMDTGTGQRTTSGVTLVVALPGSLSPEMLADR